MKRLPNVISTGTWQGGHIQGIAIDRERKYIYCSFTTELIKLDLNGKLIGSVKGFTGHLGCLAYSERDGRVYASLEYKNDIIGKSILHSLGIRNEIKNAFYVAMFDGEKINRPNMNAETDGVMTTVFLREPTEDYLAEWDDNGKTQKHRFGCSGIDGITFAPIANEMRLLVAYGIYGDVNRTDNDHQVLLSYVPEELKAYETVLTAENIHENGPASCKERFFVHTGNTTFGVQNMEYDPFTGNIFLAVYPGKKPCFPNFKMFAIDGSKASEERTLEGLNGQKGKMLCLKEKGLCLNSVYGYYFPFGSTGMISLGNGYFYFSEDKSEKGAFSSNIRLYRYTDDPEKPFLPA
ncbi:MAG: hypothetical protein IKD07_04145 [Clostridia bacterium]|nr:hypothetical protein [Clostridia bacterium]